MIVLSGLSMFMIKYKSYKQKLFRSKIMNFEQKYLSEIGEIRIGKKA
jgi:hypothetical protein